MAASSQSKMFVPPTAKQRVKALGETDNLNGDIRRALTIAIDQSFPLMPIQQPGDWLYEQEESGQTVSEYQDCRRAKPTPSCNLINIQPLGDFNGPRSPNLDIVCEFSHLFFPSCRVETLPSIEFNDNIAERIHPATKQPQYLLPDIFRHLKKLRRKRGNRQELFTIGVTMMDIYPNPRWNFVYGEASPEDRIGIYSFARFDPQFPSLSQTGCTNEEQILILRRAVSTYLHEVMHLFGFEHCIYYLCLMNGANGEEELDQSLIYLCPVCLKKMYLTFGQEHFRIMEIYQAILELSKRVGFEKEVKWYENRLKLLNEN